jgi:hypothetical protein
VSVNLIEVGEHLLGRAVDLDAVLDHGFDPLLVVTLLLGIRPPGAPLEVLAPYRPGAL